MSQVHPRPRPLRRSMGVVAMAIAASTLAALASPSGCGADNAVVGGSCAAGYTQCGSMCVDTTDDPQNCGGCGIVCPSGACVDSMCVVGSDAGHDASSDAKQKKDAPETDTRPYDGPNMDGPLHDGPTTDGPPHDGPTLDGPPHDGPNSDASDGPASDVSMSDSPPSDVIATDVVEESCKPPDKDCGGICVDEQNDPNNCGTCGKVCPSGICVKGLCVGSTEGDIVIIGHDYHSSMSTVTEGKIVANAVFLPSSNPIRILSFEEYSDPTSVSNVKSALSTEATLLGRTLKYTVTTLDSYIPSNLTISNFDVLIVYDQEAAAPKVLGPLGTSWAPTLASFTVAGGVVVSLDGAAGTTQEMPAFDTNGGLLTVTGHTVIPGGTPLDVIAPGDVIGHGVFSPYAAEDNTVYFTTPTLSGGDVTYVVVDPLDAGQVPVVIHVDVP